MVVAFAGTSGGMLVRRRAIAHTQRHAPRRRGIQYAVSSIGLPQAWSRRTGSSAFADDDTDVGGETIRLADAGSPTPPQRSKIALAVASSVIRPLIRPPLNAAAIAGTLAAPTAAPMVVVLAGTSGGMLVRRLLVPALSMRPLAS